MLIDKYSNDIDRYGAYSVFELYFELSTKVKESSRSYYNMLNLIGDLGGVLEIFIFLFGIIFFKISAFSLQLKLFEKLFIAYTEINDVFNIR